MSTTKIEQDKVTINGVEYVKISAVPDVTLLNSNIQIVILQRGWVMIGRFKQEGEQCTLDQAAVIRQWGTKKGLGELAAEGPKAATILDPCGHVEFHILTVVARIASREDLWASKLV